MSCGPSCHRFAKPLGVAVLVGLVVVAGYFATRKPAPSGSYNLGRIPLASEILHEFVVSNPFPDRLVLSGVRTTHPDATIVAYDPVIPPHGQGSVRVQLSPAEVGPLQARFFIDYAGHRHGLRQLAFHGVVAPPALPAQDATLAPDLLISASELLALLNLPGEQTPVVVDVRGAEDYQRSHLPESLNMPSFQLKASQHLKTRPLVLVGDGPQTAAQLQKAGFESVRILDGGIPAWQALGAPLLGSERGLPAEISPAAFLQAASSQEGWQVIDARTKDLPLPISAPSTQVSMESLQSPDSIAKLGLPKGSKVIILTDQGAGRESLHTFTETMKGVPLCFVRGGADAVNRELLRIARSQIKPVTASINGTATASNKRFSRSIGGCRSCP
ncbi:MAG: rhodanese-like domain-containing protein [Terrimicrobiaceae bacterium]